MDSVIEDVYEKEHQEDSIPKDGSPREHNRTSSDSGQGSHEGSMTKRDKTRNKSEGFPNEEPDPDGQVFEIPPGDDILEIQGKTDTIPGEDELQYEVDNGNNTLEQEGPAAKPRKKRKRRRKRVEEENNQVVGRPLPELRSVKSAVNEGNFNYSAGDISNAAPEDKEIMTELQIHQPPPPRLKPIAHKREQVGNCFIFY